MGIKDNNNKVLKYSLNIFCQNTGITSYRYFDTSCKGRDSINLINSNNINDETFNLKIEHNIDYEDHNYIRIIIVKKDYDT